MPDELTLPGIGNYQRLFGGGDVPWHEPARSMTPPMPVTRGALRYPTTSCVRCARTWVEQAYPTLVYFHRVDRGGHFAAWEEPELFSAEVRAAFRGVR